MDNWTEDTLKARCDELGPWYHRHSFPFGVGHTPEQEANQRVTRMLKRMEEHGAFHRAVYPEVLDLGANSGLLAMWFVDNKSSEVMAVDNNSRHLDQLALAVEVKGYGGRVIPLRANILTSAFGKDRYDLVLLLGVMNLVPTERRIPLLEVALQALKPGCDIAVQTWDEIPVLELLESAGFEGCRKLYTHTGRDPHQAAWVGTKPVVEKWYSSNRPFWGEPEPK